MEDYRTFLRGKIAAPQSMGIEDVEPGEVNPLLMPHQRDLVVWGCRGGRRAFFAAFGLGKTFIQLETVRILKARTGHRALIVLPLGVRQEFRADAEKLGISTGYVRTTAEALACTADVCITNYERVRDGGIDVDVFGIVSLDEASVLRGYGTKTFQSFLSLFAAVPYRFVATATPAPNRYKELIHYAGFLGIMDTGQALTRFFKRDSTKANNLTLHPHKEREFWLWMAGWACFLSKPSDLGYDDAGYDLPPLRVTWHVVSAGIAGAQVDRDGQVLFLDHAAASLTAASRVKRETIDLRVARMAEIVAEHPERNFLLWHDQEAERHAIRRAIPEATEVFGSMDIDERERRVVDFSNGRCRHLATKPVLSGSGCNFQRHCADAVFLGVSYKFNDFVQAIHRIYRFMQEREVNIHIIYMDTESGIVEELKRKWTEHDRLVAEMGAIIRKYGLSKSSMKNELIRTMGLERECRTGDNWTAINNDCVEETAAMPENSVDLIVTSIPFGNHYEYSPSYNDFGHNPGNDAFFQQMDYLTPELLRVLRPGRVYCCHVKDRIEFGNVTGKGMPTVDPFHMLTTLHTMRHGFAFMGMITIETDVVRENNQTYRLGWAEQCKDGSKMGVGCPEYLLLFRKLPTDTSTAYADVPVSKSKEEYPLARWQIDARAKWNSSGNRLLDPVEVGALDPQTAGRVFRDRMGGGIYSYEKHVATAAEMDARGALPKTFETLRVPARTAWVWEDVCRMTTLNKDQRARNLMMHLCPLQFDIVDRCIERFSNAGEVVYDPFGGVMTVPYRAVLKGRKGIGCELNPSYFVDGIGYLEKAERLVGAPSLFDLEGIAG